MTPKNAIDTVMRLRALGGGWRGTVRRAIGICRTEGLNGIRRRLLSHGFGFSFNPAKGMPPSGAAAFDYPEWCRRYSRWDSETVAAIRKQVDGLKKTPLFSALMPVFDPPLAAFQNAIESLIAQVYGHWELCIVDDASKNPEVRGLIEKYVRSDNRIIARHHTVNGHISRASNSALEMARKDLYSRRDVDRRRKWRDSACFARMVGGTNNRRWTVIMAFPLAAFNLLSGRYRQENCESALSLSVR